MELRKFPRFPVRIPILFSGDHVQGYGRMTNISMGGCTVESSAPLHTGASVKVLASLPGHEPPLEVQLALLRWSTTSSFGLQFVILPADAQERVRRFISNI